jgi:hypothetical protein
MSERFSPELLWQAMRKADVSPTDLADELGCPMSTVTAWFDGATPRPLTLKAMARVLEVDVRDLTEAVA